MPNRRVKSDKLATIPIKDFKHADEIIRRIGDAQKEISQYQYIAGIEIDNIKADLAVDIKPHQEKIKQLTESLEVFAELHRDEFGKKRSRKLNFGLIGWRKSKLISIKKKTLSLIKQVFSKKDARNYIRVKESVDKEQLAKLTDEQLAIVKARRVQKDVFFAEPFLLEAVDYKE